MTQSQTTSHTHRRGYHGGQCRQTVSTVIIVAVMISARPAWAGMPSFTLTEVASWRFQSISFFLAGFFVAAAVIRAIWNSLAQDFTRLPRLSYWRACGLVFIWGMLFLTVLTMISGARELLTPGEWEKDGATYKLKEHPAATSPATIADEQIANRKAGLMRLRELLFDYKFKHDGRFPAAKDRDAIFESAWNVPGRLVERYVYAPPATTTYAPVPLAYEPQAVGDRVFVLFTDGEIRQMPFAEVLRLRQEAPR